MRDLVAMRNGGRPSGTARRGNVVVKRNAIAGPPMTCFIMWFIGGPRWTVHFFATNY